LAASEFGDILVEEFIDGRGKEYACGILEDDVQTIKLPVCEIRLKTKYFSSESKYEKDLHDKIIPSNLDENQTRRMQDIANKIHSALGCLGMSRTDMAMTEDNEIYVFEINTLPGLLPISIFTKECQAIGINYERMVEMLTKSAFRRRPMEITKILTHHPELREEIRPN
jgi:D-alanine-D-alanine ligase